MEHHSENVKLKFQICMKKNINWTQNLITSLDSTAFSDSKCICTVTPLRFIEWDIQPQREQQILFSDKKSQNVNS